MRFISLLLGCLWLLTCAACHSTHLSPAVDRRDPEAVLRAYFAAWSNNDTATQTSFMTQNHSNLAYEPVDSLRVLKIIPADAGSPTKRVYAVSFEVKFKGGRSISMENGRYNWTYTLMWDGTRDSWLISNYGAGEEGRQSGAGAANRSTTKILLLPAAPAADGHPSSSSEFTSIRS